MTSLERSVRGQHPGTCLLQVGCDEVVTTNRAALGVTRWLVSPSVRVGKLERRRRGALTRDVHLRCRVALPAARAFAERGWPCSGRPRATRVTDWCATRPSRATSFRSGSGARPGRRGAGRGGVGVPRTSGSPWGGRTARARVVGGRTTLGDISGISRGAMSPPRRRAYTRIAPRVGRYACTVNVGHLRGWRGGRGALRGR